METRSEPSSYRPLPSGLTIKSSPIHGQGVFATIPIKQGTNFGMSHLESGSQSIHTPLGTFLNHSEKPNCHRTKLPFPAVLLGSLNLTTLKDIEAGEELTIKYDGYNPISTT